MKYFCVTVLLAVLTGTASADNKAVAREAYHEGTKQYDLGDFEAALASFKRAYMSYEDPAFLFNIALCQRQLGDKAEALRSFRVFLSKMPDASQRPSVERIIAELQVAIDHDKAAAANSPVSTPAPEPAAKTEAPATASVVTPPPTVTTSAPAPERRPRNKKWIWGVVAGGAVVVAGAVTLGVVLGTHHNPIELVY